MTISAEASLPLPSGRKVKSFMYEQFISDAKVWMFELFYLYWKGRIAGLPWIKL